MIFSSSWLESVQDEAAHESKIITLQFFKRRNLASEYGILVNVFSNVGQILIRISLRNIDIRLIRNSTIRNSGTGSNGGLLKTFHLNFNRTGNLVLMLNLIREVFLGDETATLLFLGGQFFGI
ncbi:hypothetical protein RCL_jg8457.t1 [Rhizophagus clarus]|uniref:Uncharacterized protein n=1 Tax=Rhizophagus clarus TaxID=94130 RepID=A0A8H3MIA1_9GLOM|nr:hypothetical protein RCL_jg8457.t1 [Rhizophagus clarus]